MKTIYETVMAGEPLAVPFIDAHGHFGPWPETVIPYAMDYSRAIDEMDRYGCDMAWLSASNPGYSGDLSIKNDYVFEFAEKHPDRIVPYCTLSALTPDRNAAELNRCLARGRCIGVKMHRYQQPPYTMRSDLMQPILEILAENSLVYLNHGFVDLDDLQWALRKYPDVVFMAGHFDGRITCLANEHPNLRDCTCAANGYKMVENEVKRLGRSDTMLVGSDFLLFMLGFGAGMIVFSEMPEQDKLNILGLNAIRLMQKTRWFGEVKFRKPIPDIP